jgi:hypothetical protein
VPLNFSFLNYEKNLVVDGEDFNEFYQVPDPEKVELQVDE